MVRPRLAECESEPLVPSTVSVEFPVAVLMAAENRIGALEPAVTLKGLTGFDTTPAGKPLSVTWTVPVKPLSGSAESVTDVLVAPCWTVTEFWEKAREKSGRGGGGGGV